MNKTKTCKTCQNEFRLSYYNFRSDGSLSDSCIYCSDDPYPPFIFKKQTVKTDWIKTKYGVKELKACNKCHKYVIQEHFYDYCYICNKYMKPKKNYRK